MKYISTTEVTKTINSILEKYNIPIVVKEKIDLTISPDEKLIKWLNKKHKISPNDKISQYLKQDHFQQYNIENIIFYHYIPKKEYFDQIIKSNNIRLYNLNKYSKQEDGDKTEYQCFLDSFGINFPNKEEQINSTKNNIFIWCLTNSGNSEEHWKKFASNGNGVLIALRFKNLKQKGLIDIIKVQYKLDFLEEIQNTLKYKFDLNLEISYYPTFAKFFKKQDLIWEDEIRLCIDVESLKRKIMIKKCFNGNTKTEEEFNRMLTINEDENKEKYINLPLKNILFEIEIINGYFYSGENFHN